MPQTGENTHFGFQQVALGDKQARVDDVFHSVARRYDLMNDLMSGGLHRAWKDVLVTAVNPPKARASSDAPGHAGAQPFALLDLAGGTGDVAFRAIEAGGAGPRATVVDINADMLAVGPRAGSRARARRRHHVRRRQRRGAAVSGSQLRCGHHRFRHPQRAAHRGGAGGGPSRAADRRALPVPRILHRRCARARRALRFLFVQRDPGARSRRRRRRGGLPLSGGIDPPLPAARRHLPR